MAILPTFLLLISFFSLFFPTLSYPLPLLFPSFLPLPLLGSILDLSSSNLAPPIL